MTLASIDWFRAAVDVAAIFATGLLCQWWGWRKGYQRGRAIEQADADARRCRFRSPYGQGRCVLPALHDGTHYAYPQDATGDKTIMISLERLP